MQLFIKSLVFLIFSLSTIHANYIDTRDMTSESQKIQRLLGTLDALKVMPSAQNSPNGTQIAMLTLMTSGLALAATSSYYHPVYSYHRPVPYHIYNSRKYDYRRRPNKYYYHRSNPGVAVGAAIATAGIIGAIAASAAQDNQNRAYQKQEEIQKEINTIISNLIATDQDYISENNEIETVLVANVEKDIVEIDNIISNEIESIMAKEEQYLRDFIDLTNTLTLETIEYEQKAQQLILDNIQKMSETDISKSAVKELKALNKEIKAQIKKKEKENKKQLKIDIKDFNKQYEIIKEQNQKLIIELESTQSNRILAKVDSIKESKADLFQKYISAYINKLAVY